MDLKSVSECDSRLGTGTIIVLDDRTCPVGFVHNLEHFFAQESCGWCTPCREGLPWVEKILQSIEDGEGQEDDLQILQEHTHGLGPGMTFCALAPGAMAPLQSALKYFSDDFKAHIDQKKMSLRGKLMATINIDGQSFEVDSSKNLLEVMLSLGFDLPYFCWHPALGSVGSCRQCAVKKYQSEDDNQGQLIMACMEPALDGLLLSIGDQEAVDFREKVIEWLMLNHPHDCPICDEGGECHLQDMTVMAGHAYRRTRFKKRTHHNQGPWTLY